MDLTQSKPPVIAEHHTHFYVTALFTCLLLWIDWQAGRPTVPIRILGTAHVYPAVCKQFNLSIQSFLGKLRFPVDESVSLALFPFCFHLQSLLQC